MTHMMIYLYGNCSIVAYRIAGIFGEDVLRVVDRVPNLDTLILSITNN